MLRGLEERLRLALEGTETGFWEWDVATDTVEWSDNMGPLYDLPRGTQPDGVADFLDRIVHPEDRERIAGIIQTALRDVTGYEFDLRVALPDRGERWLHTRAQVLADEEGRAARIIGLLSDVTERRYREEARVFLDTASQRLAASMDPVRTLEEVAELAVPRLADWCAVQLATDTTTGAFEQVAVAHADPDKVRWARELQQRYPPDPDSPTGAPAVIRSGRSELYPEIDQALLEAAALDEEQIRLVRELQMHSVMIVPMTVRERTVGAITFVWAESGRRYEARDLELAEELGRRAGLALDHARLFSREHRTAELLQRALLPGRLPELPGYELAVRYVPSDARDHAGGDWYDAFPLPDGRVGIVIGDVGGRGLEAAATMGQIRNALRAYALKGASAAGGDRRPARARGPDRRRGRVRHRRLRRARPRHGPRRGRDRRPSAAADRRCRLPGHAALPAAGLRRRHRLRARARSRSRSGRRCGCTPTGWWRAASGRSTPAWGCSRTPRGAPRVRSARSPTSS